MWCLDPGLQSGPGAEQTQGVSGQEARAGAEYDPRPEISFYRLVSAPQGLAHLGHSGAGLWIYP